MSWVSVAFTSELRKTFSYRVDFWLSMLGAVAAEVGVAYFLWQAVFAYTGSEQIGGFTFERMLVYYLFVPFVFRMVRGDEAMVIAHEIYEGHLNRYLIFPVNFLGYKYFERLAKSSLILLQLILALVVVLIFFDMPPGVHLSLRHFIMGVVSCYVGGILYFAMSATLELITFWADYTWSLLVMLRFVAMFFGGGLVPLSLFPEWGQTFVRYTPFPYVGSYQIQTLMGELSFSQWLMTLAITLAWCAPFFTMMKLVWTKGTKRYTGVGI